MTIDLRRLPPHFHEITTADGSPSLSYRSAEGAAPEGMHHAAGARAETLYVYGPVIEFTLLESRRRGGRVRLVSLGLGLGYHEILAAALALKSPGAKLAMNSFESDPFLRASFAAWLEGQNDLALAAAYEKICAGFGVRASDVREVFLSEAGTIDLILEDRLDDQRQIPDGVTGFLWDAFSRKTSPELWEEEFLVACFRKASPYGAQLATYARNGPLKRALHRAGFQLQDQPGFANKRSSTRARRVPQVGDDLETAD